MAASLPNNHACSPFWLNVCLLTSILLACSDEMAWAVRPFVTDDARIVYKGQVETESFSGISMSHGSKPTIEARSLQGASFTDRFELIGGGFGFTYRDGQARPLDMLIQPKYLVYRSFGAIPSVSVAAASLFPLSGKFFLVSKRIAIKHFP